MFFLLKKLLNTISILRMDKPSMNGAQRLKPIVFYNRAKPTCEIVTHMCLLQVVKQISKNIEKLSWRLMDQNKTVKQIQTFTFQHSFWWQIGIGFCRQKKVYACLFGHLQRLKSSQTFSVTGKTKLYESTDHKRSVQSSSLRSHASSGKLISLIGPCCVSAHTRDCA